MTGPEFRLPDHELSLCCLPRPVCPKIWKIKYFIPNEESACMLGKILADNILKYYSYFFQKIDFGSLCKLSP